MNDAVEDGVGEGRDADQLAPAGDRNLAGDDERAFVVAVVDDFQEIAGLVGAERLRSPIVKDQQPYAGEGAQRPGVARIAMRDGEIGEQSGNAGVENGQVFPARLVAERAGEPTLGQRPLAPVMMRLRRSAIQSQAASLRNSARSSPREL